MLTIKRTDSNNVDFQQLILQLDALLDERDKDAHSLCKQYNQIEAIKHVILIYDSDHLVGCGAIRLYMSDSMEIKRMFVPDSERRKGIASIILKELECWAKELGAKRCILETGEKLPEAIFLYERNNYIRIPNYGQYDNIKGSICYQKELDFQE